jgi:hypothetical protein
MLPNWPTSRDPSDSLTPIRALYRGLSPVNGVAASLSVYRSSVLAFSGGRSNKALQVHKTTLGHKTEILDNCRVIACL